MTQALQLFVANLLAMAFLAACVWFVHTDHPGFAIACLIGAYMTSHTISREVDKP